MHSDDRLHVSSTSTLVTRYGSTDVPTAGATARFRVLIAPQFSCRSTANPYTLMRVGFVLSSEICPFLPKSAMITPKSPSSSTKAMQTTHPSFLLRYKLPACNIVEPRFRSCSMPPSLQPHILQHAQVISSERTITLSLCMVQFHHPVSSIRTRSLSSNQMASMMTLTRLSPPLSTSSPSRSLISKHKQHSRMLNSKKSGFCFPTLSRQLRPKAWHIPANFSHSNGSWKSNGHRMPLRP